jgi:4-oxalocrotonate tautomerase
VIANDAATTFVVIDEVAVGDRGVGGVPADEHRRRAG